MKKTESLNHIEVQSSPNQIISIQCYSMDSIAAIYLKFYFRHRVNKFANLARLYLHIRKDLNEIDALLSNECTNGRSVCKPKNYKYYLVLSSHKAINRLKIEKMKRNYKLFGKRISFLWAAMVWWDIRMCFIWKQLYFYRYVQIVSGWFMGITFTLYNIVEIMVFFTVNELMLYYVGLIVQIC